MGVVKTGGVAIRTRRRVYALDDSSLDKVISIGEVADRFGVTVRAVRFYEEMGLLQPKRSGAMRLYSHSDCSRLETILTSIRLGFSLREIKEMINRSDLRVQNASCFGLTLEHCQKQLARLQNQQRALEETIRELTALMLRINGHQGSAREV